MKILLAASLLLAAAFSLAQDQMMMAPPKELAKAGELFLGNWTGSTKMSMGDGSPASTYKGGMIGTKTLNGMYIQTMNTMDMGEMGKMSGMYMLTYDPVKKQYLAYWFDSSAPGGMEFSGNFEGDKLVMVSKPADFPGMPPGMVMRATWQKTGNKLSFLLDMKQGEKWGQIMEGTYTKK